jgi:ribonuclease inhibitor
MKEIVIDCRLIPDAPALHRTLAEALGFPEWYGHNLDALHDCLTEISEDTKLTLQDFDHLGTFRAGFRVVLNAAEEENSHLFVYIQ